MSLPVAQQRVLNHIEDALRASEPRLTSMYAIFARLSAGEPVQAERLIRRRPRWRHAGTAMYAIVLVPVMFAAILVGALLGGGARNTGACEASYSVGGVSPLAGRPACPGPAAKRPADRAAAKAAAATNAVRQTATITARLACATAGQVVRFTAPAAGAGATAAGPPLLCFR